MSDTRGNDPAAPAAFIASQWRERLRKAQFEDEAAFALGTPAEELIAARARRVDEALRAAYAAELASRDGLVLAATGGYGRGELYPQSDIDLLLIIDRDDHATQVAIERFLASIWNIGLSVSHITRTPEQCLRIGAEDLSSATAMFESRYLAGAQDLLAATLASLDAHQVWPARAFFEAKRDELRARHVRFNDTSFNLEPNVKEGPGAIRDLDTLGWMARRCFGVTRVQALAVNGLASAVDQAALDQARAKLSRLRYGLHRAVQRREERLLFDHQRELARLFGYADQHRENLAVEQLMQGFFRAASSVRLITQRLLLDWEERLAPEPSPTIWYEDGFGLRRGRLAHRDPAGIAARMVGAIAVCHRLATMPAADGLNPELATAIQAAVPNYQCAEESSECVGHFLSILKQPLRAVKVLRVMSELDLLGRMIPAFERVTGRMQYDMFHAYTVDQHTLRVLDHIARFADAATAATLPLAVEVRARLRKPELLLLAGLFHDIAKGRGGDHSELGERDARDFVRWLGLSQADADLVAWLVRHHLDMSITAQKQDIGDPAVVHRFATLVADWERLDYLYLLTVADISGTSPKLWNTWKDRLLADLYDATRFALRRGLEHPVHSRERVAETLGQARELLQARHGDVAGAERVWADYPEDSVLRFSPTQLAWQAEQVLAHDGADVARVAIRNDGSGGTELLVVSRDRDGLFATITAVLDRMQINVHDARIVTTRDGRVLDTFQVLDAQGLPLADAALGADLCRRITDELGKPALNLTPARRAWSRQQKHFHVPLRVEFGERDGGARTQLALVCSDRPGLLAHVAQAFRACGVRVHDARIATFGERVEDFFVLSDEHDRALDAPATQSLERTLAHELAPLR
ncbi:MAG TPA: [protein-PII] uridylyltransferase [Patescibacteria group bacterium]|nr:[protein-PII] uridylyltransferase [Patescibacteria group bacterium]